MSGIEIPLADIVFGIGPYISLRPRPLDKSLLVLRTSRRASQELLSLRFQPDFKHAISFFPKQSLVCCKSQVTALLACVGVLEPLFKVVCLISS